MFLIRVVEAATLLLWGVGETNVGKTNVGKTNAGGQIFNGAHSQDHLLATTLCLRVVNPVDAHVCR